MVSVTLITKKINIMKYLKQQFQEETELSFNDIPINGVHLEYINWLEKRIEALTIPVVSSTLCEHNNCSWNKDPNKLKCLDCGEEISRA